MTARSKKNASCDRPIGAILESNDFADKLAKTGSGEPCITFAGVQVHWLTISGISAFTRPGLE
jgi:hypothetical protein